jgi:fatty-acyl-CoA synthase
MGPPLLSIAKGPPLSEEPGLGTLTLPGFLREVTTRFADREAVVLHSPNGIERWSYATLWERAVERCWRWVSARTAGSAC